MDARTAAWTVSLVGLWVLLTPFVALDFQTVFWSNFLAGIVVTIAGFAMIGPYNWQGWTAGMLGLWIIVSALIPFLLFGPGLWWNGVITGTLSAATGFTALAHRLLKKKKSRPETIGR